MWHWILCYLAGQHEFAVVCERDAIFLQCRSCGRRSHGWELSAPDSRLQEAPATRARRFAEVPASALVRRHHYSA